MDTKKLFEMYKERAKSASSPAVRTVNMLGMMCATAVAQGAIFAFVGRGYGSDWPNARGLDDYPDPQRSGTS